MLHVFFDRLQIWLKVSVHGDFRMLQETKKTSKAFTAFEVTSIVKWFT
jgi:hypothetical protein